jgi:hypothetical protein
MPETGEGSGIAGCFPEEHKETTTTGTGQLGA